MSLLGTCMNRVIHFDIQADDVERAKKFYQNVFGWKIEQAMKKEDGGMDYWMVDTGKGSGIGGGLSSRKEAETKSFQYDCTIEVEDIDKALADIKKNGGKIISDKMELPKIGFFARVKDTEGNVFNIMQPTEWSPQ